MIASAKSNGLLKMPGAIFLLTFFSFQKTTENEIAVEIQVKLQVFT